MRKTIDSALNTAGLADEQRGLLDLVDKLQFAQLDDVKLPQIVVVGDQSAGKSSVLEALTGTPFPRDAGACTRFATEIRMRRARDEALTVSVIPDRSRPFAEQERLRQFGGTVGQDTPFDAMMRDAVELIAPRNIPGRFAARDILVVEKRGPDMPLLTLVDLPGLVRVANRDQSEADIQTIEALSERYMKSPRTIILAVVGGNNDYVQAPILKKARHFDPKGSRTIGVLTKPDLTEKIGLEDKFIGLVTNQDQENHFKLGWYVLLNPGPPAPGQAWPGAEERAAREDAFFSSGKWSTLAPSQCGVAPLRQKLSVQLQRHIGRHVGTLRKQIAEAHARCEAQLKALGVGKDTVEEMRFQMGELFSASNNLVTASVNGNYKNPPGERFFPKAATRKGTPGQKLRARVREESERFARRFRDGGRKVNFPPPPPPPPLADGDAAPAQGGGGSRAQAGPTSGHHQHEVVPPGARSRREFARTEVEPLLRQIRGTELPMDSNPRAPYILFQDYSENWPVLAQEYKDNLGVICSEFLAEVIEYVWPARMRPALRAHFLEPHVSGLMAGAEKELGRLVDDMELEVQPFDPEYERRLMSWRATAAQNGAEYSEAEEVLEKMLIYYDLTARIFLRNVVTQVGERHLLLGMLRLFNPVEILRMQNSAIEAIAAEDKQTRDRRLALKEQKKAIEEAKSLCASLAMRSELRGYDDDDDDERDDEEGEGGDQSGREDEGARRYYNAPTPRSPGAPRERQHRPESQQQAPPPQQSNGQYAMNQQQLQQQQQQHRIASQAAAQNQRASRADPQRTSSEWAPNYYATSGPVDSPASPHAPSSAPPPPPRPPKADEAGYQGRPDTPPGRSSYAPPVPEARPESKRERRLFGR